MAENVVVSSNASRSQVYAELLPQVAALIEPEDDLVANLANTAAALKHAFDFFWVGFYLHKNQELVLGPFQGPVACTRIEIGRGVCGHAFKIRETVIVPNVDEFPGHIACSSASRSEIVVPVIDKLGVQIGVLDVDSERLNDFSDVDRVGLENIVALISKVHG